MYQVSKVQTALASLIGWKQSTLEEAPKVSASNLLTTSGMYFLDFSPLLDTNNIFMLQEDTTISEAQFNTILSGLLKSSIVKVCGTVFGIDDFCENRLMYRNPNGFVDTLDNDAKFVGFEITPPKGNYLIQINNVITTFNGIDTIKLLCFHSGKQDPLFSKEITTIANEEQETPLGWVLPYNYGEYYIGYLRGGLTAKAINRKSDAAIMSKYNTLSIEEICIPHNTETIFNIEDTTDTDDTYGLNLDISSYKDFTSTIINNKTRFANAIGLQVAVDVADMILKSTRSNVTERNLKPAALMEKEGIISMDAGTPRVNSLVNKLKSELKELQRQFAGIRDIKIGTL